MATDKSERKTLRSPIGIGRFVHLFEPFAFKSKGGKEEKKRDPQYQLTLVYDKATVKGAEFKEMKKACMDAAVAKFGQAVVDKLIAKNKLGMPWRDNEEYEDYEEPFSTLKGGCFVSFKSNTAPGIVDKRAEDIMNKSEIYDGAKFRVTYFPWAYDTDGNKGITLLLNNVQKTGDGKRLGGGRREASEEFDSIEGDDGDDDGDDVI